VLENDVPGKREERRDRDKGEEVAEGMTKWRPGKITALASTAEYIASAMVSDNQARVMALNRSEKREARCLFVENVPFDDENRNDQNQKSPSCWLVTKIFTQSSWTYPTRTIHLYY
jgi:hypothetical protein